jgi:uncharacterized protein
MDEVLKQALPWLVILPALLLIWIPRARTAALALVGLGYLLAFIPVQLTPLFLLPLAILAGTAWAVQDTRPTWVRIAGHVAFVLTALALREHIAPGFRNPLVLDGRVSEDAPVYRMYFNLDKTLIALWVIWAWHRVRWSPPGRSALEGTGVGLATAAVVIMLGVATGLVGWDPKWPVPAGYLWLVNNAILVCLAEEAFFRGYVQEGLARKLGGRYGGEWTALAVGALLFGLAHFESGPMMIALSALAGAGYGLAYKRGGLLAAWMAHAVLNIIHFGLFTYPARMG